MSWPRSYFFAGAFAGAAAGLAGALAGAAAAGAGAGAALAALATALSAALSAFLGDPMPAAALSDLRRLLVVLCCSEALLAETDIMAGAAFGEVALRTAKIMVQSSMTSPSSSIQCRLASSTCHSCMSATLVTSPLAIFSPQVHCGLNIAQHEICSQMCNDSRGSEDQDCTRLHHCKFSQHVS